MNNKRAILCIHAWGSSPEDFHMLKAKLDEYELVCPRYTLSKGERLRITTVGDIAELIKEEIDSLKAGGYKVVLLGYSLGVFASLEYIRRYTDEAIDSLILVDMTPKSVSENGWSYGFFSGALDNKLKEESVKLINSDMNAFYRDMFYSQEYKDDARMTERVINFLIRGKCKKQIKCLWESMLEADYLEDLKNIHKPVLLIMAESEALVSNSVMDEYAKRVAGQFESRIVENTSHSLLYQRPAEIAAIIRDFLSEEHE